MNTIKPFQKAVSVITVAVAVLAAVSCGNGTQSRETVTPDTLNINTVPVVPQQVIERLPDTIYASVDRIWYTVDCVDTLTDGMLSSLDDMYADTTSVMTFRGGAMRRADFGGRLDSVPTRLHLEWCIDTEVEREDTIRGPWGGGSGWTGQPLYVEWPDSAIRRLRKNGVVTHDFDGREVMVGSLCGNVYFLNPDNGKSTRKPINAGNPLKGTISFDPTFNGFLYVGQGTPAHRPFGALTIDLYQNKIIDFFGEDPKALRRWGAYDSAALRVGQFLFRPGENGTIYKLLITPQGPKIHSTLRYKVNGATPGVEASIAVYSNYGITADNHGNILAINLDTMKPVWFYNTGDDTDATPVITEEDGGVYVYIGCEIDRTTRGYAVFAKLNIADGSEVWRIQPAGQRRDDGGKHFDGGFYASPLPGQGDCSHIIFANMVKNTVGANGAFMAIDRRDGTVIYETPLKYYAWSSPVGFVTADEGRQIVLTADCAGNIYIIEGATGKIITCERIGYNFESSPVTVGNAVIVGSRTNGIFKVSLR